MNNETLKLRKEYAKSHKNCVYCKYSTDSDCGLICEVKNRYIQDMVFRAAFCKYYNVEE